MYKYNIYKYIYPWDHHQCAAVMFSLVACPTTGVPEQAALLIMSQELYSKATWLILVKNGWQSFTRTSINDCQLIFTRINHELALINCQDPSKCPEYEETHIEDGIITNMDGVFWQMINDGRWSMMALLEMAAHDWGGLMPGDRWVTTW